MMEAAAKAYAATVRPALEASEDKQGFAKALRQAARPLVRLARPSDDGDVAAIDALVAAKLIETGILPGTDLGHFARRRVHEMAQLAKRPKAQPRAPKDTLRDELFSVVRAVGARSRADLPAVDEAVIVALKERGVDPNSRAGLAARMRAKRMAMLPWQHQMFGSAPSYQAWPVNFDGTNDYLTRGAGLTGASDSKLWTGSVWFRRTSHPGTQVRLFLGTTIAHGVSFLSTNRLQIIGRNSTPANIFVCTTDAAAPFDDTAWHHAMWSVDLSDTGKRHIYVDGVLDLSAVYGTYTDEAMDFDGMTNCGIGATSAGSTIYPGDMADFQMWFGTYVDLSVAGNRALFIESGRPVNPAIAAASLGTPIVALTSQATTGWETNNGSGGGFTENGALADGTGPVQL